MQRITHEIELQSKKLVEGFPLTAYMSASATRLMMPSSCLLALSSGEKMASFFLILITSLVFVSMVSAESLRQRQKHSRKEEPCVSCRHDSGHDDVPELCLPLDQKRSPFWKCSSERTSNDVVDSSLWDCLMDGSDGESCRSNSNNTCVWCAEPIYGLCVTPSTADKIRNLPMFNCDDGSSGSIQQERE